MANKKSFLKQAGSVVLFSCLPGMALADVSAQQVWEMWKSAAEMRGTSISIGSTSEAGGTLTLSNVSLISESPVDQRAKVKVAVSVDKIEFAEQGDGTVRVTMSPDVPWSMSFSPEPDKQADLTFVLRQSGFSTIVSGQPGDIAYEYNSDSISLVLDKLIVDGEEQPLEVSFDLNQISGSGTMADTGAVTAYSSDMKAAKASYQIGFEDLSGNFSASGNLEDLAYVSGMRVPTGTDFSDPRNLFSEGVVASGELSAGASSSHSETTGTPGGKNDMTTDTNALSSSLKFSLDNGDIGYAASSRGVNGVIKSAAIPLPQIAFAIDETLADFRMPFMKSDTPRDFKLILRLAGLNIADDLWNMVDPGQVMPRDPFTLNIDLSGKMRWLVDMFDQKALDEYDGAPPAEVEKVDVNSVELKGVGARVLAEGAFDVDNSRGPVPAPSGEVNIRAEGINGLLDNLIKMGVLPEDNANGMRMMLGLFARPGDGADALVSKIEVKPDGSVFANGQQLK